MGGYFQEQRRRRQLELSRVCGTTSRLLATFGFQSLRETELNIEDMREVAQCLTDLGVMLQHHADREVVRRAYRARIAALLALR